MIVTKVKERLLLDQENLITKEKIENVQEKISTFYDLITKEKTENVQE